MQATRFHLNWRRRGRRYPSYARLVEQFMTHLDRFRAGLRDNGLGDVIVNQWELIYVNSYPPSAGWETPADWPNVLPGLFGSPAVPGWLVMEYRAAEWAYEIVPGRGRLHVAARPGTVDAEPGPTLLLELTARGPVGPAAASKTLREGLDAGHDALSETFEAVGGKSYGRPG